MLFAYIGIFAFAGFLLSNKIIKASKGVQMLLHFVFGVSIAIIAYNAKAVGDLSGHLAYMDRISNSGISYFQLLTDGIPGQESYKFYAVFNLVCYIAVKLGNYRIAPCLFSIIDYIIVGYISVDWNENHKTCYNNTLLSMLIGQIFMPFIFVISGMRNASAVCLAALAVYLHFIKEKKATPLILGILSVFLHPVTIIVFPIVFLANKKLNTQMLLMILAIVFLAQQIATFFAASSNQFLGYLGRAYLMYSSNKQFIGLRRYLFIVMFFAVAFLVVITVKRYFTRNIVSNVKEAKLLNFFIIYMVFVLGNWGNYDLVVRPMYIMAPLASPMLYMLFNNGKTLMPKAMRIGLTLLYCSLYVLAIYALQANLIIASDFF